jgi:hypothetical protein
MGKFILGLFVAFIAYMILTYAPVERTTLKQTWELNIDQVVKVRDDRYEVQYTDDKGVIKDFEVEYASSSGYNNLISIERTDRAKSYAVAKQYNTTKPDRFETDYIIYLPKDTNLGSRPVTYNQGKTTVTDENTIIK